VYLALTVTALAHGLVCLGVLAVPKVMGFWLSLAYGYWIVFTFLALQVGIGAAVLRLPLLRDCCSSGPAFVLFAIGVGCWVSSNLLLGLGLLGWLSPAGVAAYVLVAICVSSLGLVCHPAAPPKDEPAVANDDMPPEFRWLPRAVMVLIAVWIIPYVIRTALPSTSWDGDMYHLPLARRLCDPGPAATSPGFLHLDYAATTHLFYALFLLAGAESAIAAFSFVMSLGVLLDVYVLSRHFWGPAVAWWAVLICVSAGLIWEVALTPMIDVTQAFFFLLGCHAVLLWRQHKRATGWLPAAGMMLGMALGTKYTGLALAAVVGVIVLVLAMPALKRGTPGLLASMLLSVVLACLPSLYWYARNWHDLGDPVYPFLTHRLVYFDDAGERKSVHEALTPLMATPDPSPEALKRSLEESPFAFLVHPPADQRPGPRQMLNLWDVMSNPIKYSHTPGQAIPFLFLIFFCLLLACRSKDCLVLYALAVLAFLPLAALGHMSRYLIPVVPLFAIGSAVVAQRLLTLCNHFSRSLALCGTLVVLGVLAWHVGANCVFAWSVIIRERPSAYLAANETHEDFLCRVGYGQVDTAVPDVIRHLNDGVENGLIDKQTAVLMIGESKGYRLRCRCLPDNESHEGHSWLVELILSDCDLDNLARRLKARGVEYLVVNANHIEWTVWDHDLIEARMRKLQWGMYHLARFLTTHARIVYRSRKVYVAKIS
jgi:4-amino-4-deoxy-L-arabinose transferase-like glycosyltransferase